MAEALAAALQVTVMRSPQAGHVQEVQLQLAAGSTIAQALVQAGWWQPEVPCGVWGRVRAPEHVLQDGDRVELYRALTVDPKVARRERFAQQGARGAGLFTKRRPNSKAGY